MPDVVGFVFASSLSITRNGQTVAFEKVKGDGKDPEKWKRVAPTAKDVDKDTADGMISRLSNLRALSFVDSTANTGLNAPIMTVVAKYEDGKKEDRVTFGKNGSDIYALRAGEPGAAKVDGTDFELVTKSLDELSK